MRFTALSFACISIAFILSACSIKPHSLDAPPHVKTDTFPKTYPNPSTDPSPWREL